MNHSIWILTLELRGYRKVNDSAGLERNGKGGGSESSTRYEIWNYLQARPISYQKAIKSFRDLEITSASGGGSFSPEEWSTPSHDPSSSYGLYGAGGMRAVWTTFFPSISNAFLLAARHRRQEKEALPASSVETRSTETTAATAGEDPSSSSSFSFSRNHLDGRFLFSCSKRFVVSVDCLNQRFSTGTKSKGYV